MESVVFLAQGDHCGQEINHKPEPKKRKEEQRQKCIDTSFC